MTSFDTLFFFRPIKLRNLWSGCNLMPVRSSKFNPHFKDRFDCTTFTFCLNLCFSFEFTFWKSNVLNEHETVGQKLWWFKLKSVNWKPSKLWFMISISFSKALRITYKGYTQEKYVYIITLKCLYIFVAKNKLSYFNHYCSISWHSRINKPKILSKEKVWPSQITKIAASQLNSVAKYVYVQHWHEIIFFLRASWNKIDLA